MMRLTSPGRLIAWGNVLANAYARKVKSSGFRKWKFFQTRSFRNCVNAGLLTLVNIVYCTDREKDSYTKAVGEAQKSIPMSIMQSDEYFKIGKYQESYDVLKPFEEVDNAEILWRIGRSLYHISKQQTKKAESIQMIAHAYEVIERALNLDDQNFAVHKWFAVILDAKLSNESFKARAEGSIRFKKHLLRAVELNPKDATSLYILGQYCYYIADLPWFVRKVGATIFGPPPEATFEEALRYFNKAEEVEPNFYSFNHLMLGKTYLKLEKIEKARYWLQCASTYPARTEEDNRARTEATFLLRSNVFNKTEDKDASAKGQKKDE